MRPRVQSLMIAAVLALGAPMAAAATAGAVTAPPTVLYGVDGTHSTVVRFTGTSTGTFSSATIGHGLGSVRALGADPTGNVTVLNNGSLVRLSAGGAQFAIASKLTGLTAMVVDGHGTVFVADSRRVIRIFQPSGVQAVMGAVTGDIEGLGVDASGRATVAYADANANLILATFPSAPGGSPVLRTISGVTDEGFNTSPLLESANGTVFIGVRETGGSGAHYVERINPGSSTETDVNTRLSDYAWTVDPRARVHLMQIRKWCFDPSIGDGSCTEDRSVDKVLVFPDVGGNPRSVPVTGLTLPPGGIAVSADQTTYAAADSALVRIPAVGGAAQTVAAGSYSLVTVRPGT